MIQSIGILETLLSNNKVNTLESKEILDKVTN